MIRTKTSGSDYTGKIYIPYYANIPNGKATLKYILQNIHFTTTEQETELTLARPDFPYLTLVDEEGQEYRMDRQSMYHYSVSGDFSQKMKAYIKTPKVGGARQRANFWLGRQYDCSRLYYVYPVLQYRAGQLYDSV